MNPLTKLFNGEEGSYLVYSTWDPFAAKVAETFLHTQPESHAIDVFEHPEISSLPWLPFRVNRTPALITCSMHNDGSIKYKLMDIPSQVRRAVEKMDLLS